MARTTSTVQEYIGYILSMAHAYLWDDVLVKDSPKDTISFEQARSIVDKMFEYELSKNINRVNGMQKSFDQIGDEV